MNNMIPLNLNRRRNTNNNNMIPINRNTLRSNNNLIINQLIRTNNRNINNNTVRRSRNTNNSQNAAPFPFLTPPPPRRNTTNSPIPPVQTLLRNNNVKIILNKIDNNSWNRNRRVSYILQSSLQNNTKDKLITHLNETLAAFRRRNTNNTNFSTF